jgi:hypothetical protein
MKSIFASTALAILLAGTARAQGALNVTTPYAPVFPANPVYELMISALAAALLSANPPCFSGLAEFVCCLFFCLDNITVVHFPLLAPYFAVCYLDIYCHSFDADDSDLRPATLPK